MLLESTISYIFTAFLIYLVSKFRYKNSHFQLGMLIILLPSYLMRFTLFGIPTNVLEVILALFILLNLLQTYNRSKKTVFQHILDLWHNHRFIVLGGVLLAIGSILSATHATDLLSSMAIIRSWIVLPFAYALSLLLLRQRDMSRAVSYVPHSLVLLGVLLSIVSFLQLGFGNSTYDGRLTGVFQSPNQLAFLLVPSTIASLYLWLKTRTHQFFLALFAILAALGMTFSHGAWYSLGIALFLTAIMHLVNSSHFTRLPLVLAILSILISVSLPWLTAHNSLNSLEQTTRSSLTSRLAIWKVAGDIALDHPLYGIGPGEFLTKYLAYQEYYPPYQEWAVPQPHNTYWAFYLQTGLLGLVGFLMILFGVSNNMSQKSAWYTHALLFYVVVHSLVDTLYWKNDLSLLLWIIVLLSITTHAKSSMNTLSDRWYSQK